MQPPRLDQGIPHLPPELGIVRLELHGLVERPKRVVDATKAE